MTDSLGPLSRREFSALVATGGAAALVQSCGGDVSQSGSAEGEDRPVAWVKDPQPFIQHATNLETRLELLEGLITPNELFFVRNHSATPRVNPDTYRLTIGGDGVGRSVELSYADLRGLPSESVVGIRRVCGELAGILC